MKSRSGLRMSQGWTVDKIADLTGKVVIVTGASSGLGLETASALAAKGATLIMAVRNTTKGEEAAKLIKATHPHAALHVMKLDLSDLISVRTFAEEFKNQYNTLSILINNAGIMVPPLSLTKDGFESQFGTNHLGHFALTGLLLERLIQTPGSRIVALSSLAADSGKIHFDNLDGANGYRAFQFYAQSKLANLLFSRELDYKLKEHGVDAISVAAHPGVSFTNLASRNSGKQTNKVVGFLFKLVAQPASMGALPTLYAATEPLNGGEFIGPDGKGRRKGYPTIDQTIEKLYDQDVSKRLWTLSEELTGVTYTF